MIIVKIMGGLGNQMFQYAFGLYLEKTHNREVFYDTVFFKSKFDSNTTPRTLELNAYAFFGDGHKFREYSFLSNSFVRKIIQKLSALGGGNVLYLNENSESLTPKGRTNYYIGYWQSLKFLDLVRDELVRDFELSLSLKEKGRSQYEQITKMKTIGIHIRRGDYITNTAAVKTHGTCSLEYYYAAIEKIKEKNKVDQIVFFSDDIEWVKKNFVTDVASVYIEGNELNPQIDIYLMSNCHYQVIANSSFSWWGAYLGDQSMVIYPKNWFLEKANPDFFPDSWLSL